MREREIRDGNRDGLRVSVFLSLLGNLLPLYLLIGLGFIAGKLLKTDRHSLASLVIYIFTPIVVFGFIIHLDFDPAYIGLPVIFYAVSVICGLGFLALGRKIYGDNRANLTALCCSMGNTGYFGLPLVLLFFDEKQVAIYIFMMLGGSVFEATIGYYIAARGAFSVRDSLAKLVRFPSLYAIAAGLLVNFSGFEMPEIFWTYWTYFKGAYVVTGMMIIGVALSYVDRLVFGLRFVSLVFAGKYVVLPALMYLFVSADKLYFGWYGDDVHKLMMIISIVPTAANVAAFASQMNLKPEKAATTILIGTIFALVYIPAMIWLLDMR